jgi:hypothetical protein
VSPSFGAITAATLIACAAHEDGPIEEEAAEPDVMRVGGVDVRVGARGVADAPAVGLDARCEPGPSGVVEVAEDGALGGVAVWVDHDSSTPAKVELRVVDCRLEPHVLVVGAGSTVVIVNDDNFDHELTIDGFDQSIVIDAGGRQETDLVAQGPTTLRLGDQPWQAATMITAGLGAVTAIDGRAVLDELPIGTHDVHLFHPSLGVRDGVVGIEEGKRSTLEVLYHVP